MDEVTNSKLLKIDNLTVEYTSEGSIIHAVNGVSFEINAGETLGLVGETGAGKTTVAKSILRILPDRGARIAGGEIYFQDENVLKIPEEDMRHIRGSKISMVFQDPMTALNPIMKIGDQIAGVIKLHNSITPAEAEERAKKMLEKVGITRDRFKEFPHQFSGGMKQRVIIAMALACNPILLLADEPTTALDVTVQAQVLDMIKDLKKEFNTAMLLITHDLGIVAENCDKVAVIYAGQIVEYGTREEIFHNPSHPYTIGLFGAIPDMNDEDEEWLHPIGGMPPDPANLPDGCSFAPRCPHATDKCRTSVIENVNIGGEHLCRCLLAGTVEEDN